MKCIHMLPASIEYQQVLIKPSEHGHLIYIKKELLKNPESVGFLCLTNKETLDWMEVLK